MGSTALLLRGTEGEVVADPRRTPQMDGFVAGRAPAAAGGQPGTLPDLPDLPADRSRSHNSCATSRDVLDGACPCPPPSRSRWNTSCIGLQHDHAS
jgi:hypothetical protein